jgi:uncharacterized delta-60 repeat protein
LNPDGTLDDKFQSGLRPDLGPVSGIVIQPDERILVAGNVAPSGVDTGKAILRLNSDGSVDNTFATLIDSSTVSIRAMAEQSDGKIVIVGDFTWLIDRNRFGIGRLNPDGTLDNSFGEGQMISPGPASSVQIQEDGKILIGGWFNTVTATPRNALARLNSDGTLDESFADTFPGIPFSGRFSILIENAGTILATDGVYVARLSTQGELLDTLHKDFSDDPIVGPNFIYSLVESNDGKIFIAGNFQFLNGVFRKNAALLDHNGSVDLTFDNGRDGLNNSVSAIARQADEKVVVGGAFASVNRVPRGRVARLNDDGSLDRSFGENSSGANQAVNTVAIQKDGKIIIGGEFTAVNGTSCGRIARLESDGTLDTGFAAGLSGANASVFSVASQADGKTLVAGVFARMNGVALPGLARLNQDGTIDGNFKPLVSGFVFSIALQNDGRIVIGGAFAAINSVKRGNIARLNSDGTLDTTFGDNLLGANSQIRNVAVDKDGKIFLCGDFSRVNGQNRGHIARLLSDGALDETFGNGLSGANGTVAILPERDGSVLIGGDFRSVNGLPRKYLAKLKLDGSLDPDFTCNVDDPVLCFAMDGERTFLGGRFHTVNDFAANSVARIFIEGSVELKIHQTGQNVVLSWPISAVGFVVQATSTCTDPSSWRTLPDSPVVVGAENTVTYPISDQTFFRLAK